ncbi:VOC family protein [Staphylococcus caeli]|uniref:DNA binding 3-demethylubiquinone-9 3-methyltransferase domain-containing protein n=1 Tax=Staphylococcus caeli TaxID=2201815 RepID=A0A1D4QQJ1_9STAP|nr:VOC family protein [Staphylococcus caeli]SCT32023.1 DNA binding 3-demethylubiquinone-9 3-methyltransferase domain-containing protein [Staphylococcus caeli]SCT37383.1 DNA binding 3-demethylubiquinone-9 3-methyltransferase domain-containing protein [Staphylococcus caeli]
MMQLSPFIKVDDVKEAINFYKNAFGGEVNVLNEKNEQWLHAELHISETVILHISSTYGREWHNDNTNIILTFDQLETQQSVYDALSEFGDPHMSIEKTFFGAMHGQVKDRYEVNWLMNCFLK